MLWYLTLILVYPAGLLLLNASGLAAQNGTAEEAKAMLKKAVVAVKAGETTLNMFNRGEEGFRDRDLYVFCASASDGSLTAHPTMKGEYVTLHEIVRMRRFARVAAANLRIILHEIIKYAAKTIAPQIWAKRSMS